MLFRVCADVNIYDNKFVWRSIRLLNRALCDLQFGLETALSKLKECWRALAIQILVFTGCVCAHSKARGSRLVMLSVRGWGFVDWLGVQFSKQALFSVCVNGGKRAPAATPR